MWITYDPEADALYIELKSAPPADSVDIGEGITWTWMQRATQLVWKCWTRGNGSGAKRWNTSRWSGCR